MRHTDHVEQYYISVAQAQNDLKGLAPFIMASLEYEAL
jgi:rhamnogalacturonyl hydrolase YesR